MNRQNIAQLLILWTLSASALAQVSSGLSSIGTLEARNCERAAFDVSTKLDKLEARDFEQNGSSLLPVLWDSKITLHEKLRKFHIEESLTENCSRNIRGALRSIRTVEDILQEKLYRGQTLPDQAFGSENKQLNRHPLHKDFDLRRDLRSGDVILSRGNAYTSAAISQLGEFDTQFSHLSVVYRDPEGMLWTIEAHIEVGVFVRPLEDHIDDKNFRTMVFRFDDKELSEAAATFIFNKVKSASETTGNIFYDFGFSMDDPTQLFCSEVASYAYSFASNGEVQIPLNRSKLLLRKADFVRMLEITASESFIPADLEVDPRFQIVAEWRDPAKINDILEKDSIIRSMFRWSDDHGYRLVQSSSKKSLIYRNFAWPLRRIPFLKRYVVNKLPLNMSRKLIGYFGVLESVGELLQKELKVKDAEALASRGLPLLAVEKEKVLDDYRIKDQNLRRKKLHKMFRPSKT